MKLVVKLVMWQHSQRHVAQGKEGREDVVSHGVRWRQCGILNVIGNVLPHMETQLLASHIADVGCLHA